jgi:phosphatidylglycerol---prolipoprotein diacylglyceryl transferase
MILHWAADPILIHLGSSLGIRWYSMMFALGFLIGYHMMKHFFLKEKIDTEKVDTLLIAMMLGTVIGARLGHCLFYEPEVYLRDPIRILKVWEGGLASHGGTIGILIALWFAQKKLQLPSYMWLVDRMAIPVSIMAMLIRIGNFFNSEILGKPTDGTWGVVFERVDKVPRHPGMLYEALVYLLTFFLLYWLYQKESVRQKTGILFGTMCITIFGSRILLEVFKENQVAFEAGLPLNMGQILSIPFVLLGIYLIVKPGQVPARVEANSKSKKRK